ncbi:serine O-acetyltransferase [Flavobacterium sp. LT1R49]|uniref:serine O-acetyltransferase n=1 Tax=Flavobacterium arabinosi TaxID=3398737 RepID=UPI003A83FD32
MLQLIHEIKQLKGNSKGIIFICAFRTSNFFTKTRSLKIFGFPIRIVYKILFQWVLGIDIDDTTKIGFGFNVYHGQSLIINSGTIIGRNVIIRHNTTIGIAKEGGNCPIIGDNVTIGANTVVIGDIKIGNNSIIGAGSVVIRDVPEYTVVAGNPAKIISTIYEITMISNHKLE